MEQKFLYRYVLEWGAIRADLVLCTYPIIKVTPQGYWIEINKWGGKKWMSKTARNRFAQDNEKEALKHYIRRKTYRNHCITSELERNDETIVEAKILLRKYDKKRKR